MKTISIWLILLILNENNNFYASMLTAGQSQGSQPSSGKSGRKQYDITSMFYKLVSLFYNMHTQDRPKGKNVEGGGG
jgi:hypothetical protein